jgi:hypothetical protein
MIYQWLMAALVASAHASQSWDGQLKRRDAGTPKYDPNHRCGATSVKNFMCDKKSEFPCCSVDGSYMVLFISRRYNTDDLFK